MIRSHFAPDDTILEEGNANRALHVVKSGRIRVSRRVNDSEVLLCDLVAGQTFGELSDHRRRRSLGNHPRRLESVVMSMPMQSLASFFQQHPSAATKF